MMERRKEIVEDANRQIASSGCCVPVLMAIALAITMAMASCCTCKQVPVVSDRDSTGWHTEWKADTIKEVDSVFVSVKEKGDTVWMTTYKYKYIYKTRDVEVHDTVSVVEKETIEVPVDVVKEVPRKRSWFEKTEMIGFWVLLALWGIKRGIRLRVKG